MLYGVSGGSIFFALLGQATLGSFIPVLGYSLVRRLGLSERTGLIAALGLAIDPALVAIPTW